MDSYTLYLCEKPSQARDIAAVIGSSVRKEGYLELGSTRITWCVGHLLEMVPPDEYDPRFKRWSFDALPILPDRWAMKVTPKLKPQFRVIQRLLKQAGRVVIATDADREGETIAREVLELCGYRGSVDRLWLSALDAHSVKKALADLRPGDRTLPLYHAGLGRSRADWLVGMNLTRAYTLLARQQGEERVVSVGRVQTPTLNLVVERDREIEGFKPLPYYELVIACCSATKPVRYTARWVPDLSEGVAVDLEGRCRDPEAAGQVAAAVDQRIGEVVRLKAENKSEAAPLPLDLSSLQIEASRRFGLDANAVLKAAQALYETHKATTYPRTDCRYLPLSQHAEAEAVLQALARSDHEWAAGAVAAADSSLRSRCWNDAKITAHHAIIPTMETVDLTGMSLAERQVYDLVRRYYLYQFFPPHLYRSVVCDTRVEGHVFRSKGRSTLHPGWRAWAATRSQAPSENDDGDNAQALPEGLQQGLRVQVESAEARRKETLPPARYTSGTLIAAMKQAAKAVSDPELRKVLKDTAGIGTEATRASIIETLLERGYIKKQGKHLVSTDFGRRLIDTAPDVLTDPATTALWEQVLDEIASGKSSLERFLNQQKAFIQQMIDYLRQQSRKDDECDRPAVGDAGAVPACPVCGQALRRIRLVKPKKRVFWGCSAWPDCKQTFPDRNGKPVFDTQADQPFSKPKRLLAGGKCPLCSTGNLVQKTIKNGKNAGKPFVGCSNYPKCNAFSWVDTPSA